MGRKIPEHVAQWVSQDELCRSAEWDAIDFNHPYSPQKILISWHLGIFGVMDLVEFTMATLPETLEELNDTMIKRALISLEISRNKTFELLQHNQATLDEIDRLSKKLQGEEEPT